MRRSAVVALVLDRRFGLGKSKRQQLVAKGIGHGNYSVVRWGWFVVGIVGHCDANRLERTAQLVAQPAQPTHFVAKLHGAAIERSQQFVLKRDPRFQLDKPSFELSGVALGHDPSDSSFRRKPQSISCHSRRKPE
jgi:hypothetical protein